MLSTAGCPVLPGLSSPFRARQKRNACITRDAQASYFLFFVPSLALAAVVAGLNAVNFAFEGWGDVLAALVALG